MFTLSGKRKLLIRLFFVYNRPDFRTLDGTHYPDDMKRVVYEYIMNALGRPVKIEYTTISSTSENRTAVTECPAETDTN